VTNPAQLRLLACQINIPLMTQAAERDAHLARSAALVSDALEHDHADLVALPELSSIDYSRAAFDHLDVLAEPLDGPSFKTWSTVAARHKTHIAYSFARRGNVGNYITIAVVGPDGALVGHYDKIHLCQYGASMEKEYFARGQHLLTFKVNGITCTPIICYDIRIPELSRALTITHGVDLILHCGAYARDESFATWHDFATTRALENQVYFLSLNRAGEQFGNSAFVLPSMGLPDAKTVFQDHDEDLRYFDIDAETIARTRASYTFLSDRLDDYETLEHKT